MTPINLESTLQDKEDSVDDTIVTANQPELEDEDEELEDGELEDGELEDGDLQDGDGRESEEAVGALEDVR